VWEGWLGMFIKSIKKYIQDSIFEFESISSNEGEYSRLRLLFFLLIRRPVQIFKTVKVRAIIKKRDEVFYSVNKYDKSGVDVYPETLEEFSRRFEKCMPNSLRKVGYQNMVYASNCLDNIEFSRSLKEYVDFLYDAFPYLPDMVENAYFIHDIPNNKAPAHSLHRDGLGVRFKVWLVLNAEGVIGIEYIQADAKTLDDSRYGLYSSIYPKPSKVNKKASFLQA